jgi:hypothetical protein
MDPADVALLAFLPPVSRGGRMAHPVLSGLCFAAGAVCFALFRRLRAWGERIVEPPDESLQLTELPWAVSTRSSDRASRICTEALGTHAALNQPAQ